MSYTPFIPHGSGPSYFEEIQRLERERAKLLRESGLVSTNNPLQDGRLVGSIPNTNQKFVYDSSTNQWSRIFGGGGIRKLQKTRYAKKCAKSSKKCRYSHYKNTAKRSRRRTNQK
jgi:hypothetical protein